MSCLRRRVITHPLRCHQFCHQAPRAPLLMAESRKSVPSTTVDSQLITLQHEIHHIAARASAYVAHEQTYSVVREWSEVRGCIIIHSRHGEEGTLECIQHVGLRACWPRKGQACTLTPLSLLHSHCCTLTPLSLHFHCCTLTGD